MSNYNEIMQTFRPVKCTEAKILAEDFTPINGYMYFTTDTQKLFLGNNDELMEMCASKGFYYGIKDIQYDNNGVKPDPNVLFFKDEIEGEGLPEIDDLILNKDGCFYRVRNVVNKEQIHTERLTLQGTGTGSGGGNDPAGAPSYQLTLPTNNLAFGSQTKSMRVGFRVASSSSSLDNYVNKVEFLFKNQSIPFCTINGKFDFSLTKIHYIDLIDYKNLFPITASLIQIRTYDMYGTERDSTLTIEMIDLSLEKSLDDLVYSNNSTDYIHICELNGGNSDNVSSRQLIYNFYTEDNLDTPIHSQSKTVSKNSESYIQTNLDLSKLQGHGIYVLKIYAEAILANGEKIPSNEIVCKIAYFDKSINTPLLMVSTPETTEQYTSIPLQYRLVYPDGADSYTLEIRLNNKVEKELIIYTNTLQDYDLYFERSGSYLLSCVVKELDARYETDLIIKPYTGNIPVIDTENANLLLYLSPRGKTNQELSRNTWNDINNRYTATLEGLHYGTVDGWLTDPETKSSYLKMISGSTLSLKDFKPFEYDPTEEKVNVDSRLGYGMTIELDFEINGTLDYDTEVIKCISYNLNKIPQVGFGITGNKIRFYNSRLNGQDNKGYLLTANLVEGKRVRVSFVIESKKQHSQYPMAYIYLDGILSGAVIYDQQDKFVDDRYQPATLNIEATDAQVKLYGVRFYSTALTHRAILNNYTASLDTNEEREYSYNSNNVFNSSNKIDYLKVANANYQLDIPYMTITGGWKTEENNKWQLLNSSSASVENNPGLPTGKKDYRLIDVEVHYPKKGFENYKDYSFTNEFKSGKTMAEAYGEKPSNGGAIMYAQGTSSMEYPVKNLRLRFKKENDWFTVRPDIQDVEIICMKADYMESSGSHNTGAANFVDEVYSSNNLATPGQKHFHSEDNTIVTCIKGHPCLIFYRPDKDTPYEYIGKYNLNLDKATPEPFGFNHDNSDFGYLPVGEKYYKVTYYDKDDSEVEPFIGQANPTEGGDYYPDQTEVEAIVQEGEKINSIHCFEFLDNAVEVCNFVNKAKKYIEDKDGNLVPDPSGGYYTYEETWYNTFTNANKQVPGWTLGFESRYPEDRVGYHDADMLYPLASWINELQTLRETDEKQALARFKNEYQCYLNKDFLLAYYLITEALLMVDSRVKNMMIATWGKKRSSYIPLKFENDQWIKDTSQDPIETNFYEFYPIFYDMDTMLGLDNTGVYRFNYYEEDTDEAVYNGRDILWNLVRDSLKDELPVYYSELEDMLHENKILPYFNNNQADMANQAFYNGDADYKYLGPARNGYVDHLNNKTIKPGDAPYLYAAQGNRSLMREWFVNNRMKFLRGKYTSSIFRSGDRVEFRWYFPKEDDNDERLALSAKVVPPDGYFKLTSLQTGYAGVDLGANSGSTKNMRFNGEETKEFYVESAGGANGTEAYLLGLSNLADLGDLSNKYMQKFILGNSDIRLKRLILGNPHRHYYNKYWSTNIAGDSSSGKIGLSNCYYLQEFNLQNCDTYTNTLDFSDSSAIETILLTGSGVSGVTLPSNGILKELRLPVSVTNIVIDTHPYLTEFSIGGYDYEAANSDIINDKQYYLNDYSAITTLNVINTPIDTYTMAITTNNLSDYNLQGIDWTITENNIQFCAVTDKQVDFNSGKTYYYYDSQKKEYVQYNATIYPKEGLLFERYEMIDKDNNLVCIPILDQLLTKTPLTNNSHADSLSGTILIDIPNISVNEYGIYKKYAAKYPNITIKYGSSIGEIEKAYKVDFYQQENINDDLVPYYSVLHDGTENLASLISANGPNGKPLTTPIKQQNNQYKYEFNGIWTVAFADGESSNLINQKINQEDFINIIPKGNMAFSANYSQTEREYNVTLYQDDRKTILLQTTLLWGDKIGEKLANHSEITYNYKPYTDNNSPHNRYTFMGWQSSDDNTNKVPAATWPDLMNLTIQGDFTAYAYYIIEDSREQAFDQKYFNFENYSDTTYGQGYAISINPLYKNKIEGHITIPSIYKDLYGNEYYITYIKDFSNMTKLTDVYFLEDNKYKGLLNNSFKMDSKENSLKNVYLPKTEDFKFIYSYSFYNCWKLEHITLDETNQLNNNIEHIGTYAFGNNSNFKIKSSLYLNGLPENLKTMDASAFVRSGNNVIIEQLPIGLQILTQWSLAYCNGVNIMEFGSTEPGQGLTTIQGAALYDSGPNISEIKINSSIAKLAVGEYAAFSHYAANATKLTTAKPASLIKDLDGNSLTSYVEAGLGMITVDEGIGG